MPSTPPRSHDRIRTPPTPLHGSRYDTYEPYSPRRSKRSTAQTNPYSSFYSGGAEPHEILTTPPATAKRARFTRVPPTQLDSPPSSPVSPVRRANIRQTPRKQGVHKQAAGLGSIHSDSDASAPSSRNTVIAAVNMLPTPRKTPTNMKRTVAAPLASASRILSFHPNHPNDIMPSPRSVKRSRQRSRPQFAGREGFELYDEAEEANSGVGGDGIEIYTDASARVPILDGSEDNPFVGAKKRTGAGSVRRRKARSAESLDNEERLRQKVARDEGVVYVFRGKKIFRRFEDDTEAAASIGSGEEAHSPTGATLSAATTPSNQRTLRHQAGATAQRPLTRSAIKPRLLFPSEEQLLEREQREEEADEEAATDIDIEMTAAPTGAAVLMPVEPSFELEVTVSPPSTVRKGRARKVKIVEAGFSPLADNAGEEVEKVEAMLLSPPRVNGHGKRKARSPFDDWQRTKATTSSSVGTEDGVDGHVGRIKRTRADDAL